ncbi:MAG: hypothetical protein V4477_04245 [Pseudomonadota bacterium]
MTQVIATMTRNKKRVDVDELIWLIHQELLARVGKGKSFSFSISPDKEHGWAVRTRVGGRRLHPIVQTALSEIELEFQEKYSIPRDLLLFEGE